MTPGKVFSWLKLFFFLRFFKSTKNICEYAICFLLFDDLRRKMPQLDRAPCKPSLQIFRNLFVQQTVEIINYEELLKQIKY